jgi:phosphoserine aminotransferase
MLWNCIDNSNEYFKSKITDKSYRSNVNVIFRIQGGSCDLEKTFIKLAMKAGITQIVAHTYNPGVRISTYNAITVEEVAYLCDFIRRF